MKRRLAQAVFTTICTTAVVVGLPEKGEACLFGLFGCHGCYSAPCGPCYSPGYVPMQTYYAPSYNCAPACSPCGVSCSPCGYGCSPCSGGSCPGGVCSVPAQGDGWRASEPRDDEPPRTYQEDPGPLGPPADDTPPGDGGFGREPAPFGDTPESGVSGGIETRRPPEVDEGIDSQPGSSPSDDSSPATDDGSGGGLASPANIKTAPVGPVLNVVPLGLDRRITASTQPVHSRLRVRSAFRSPMVVRNTNLPRGDRQRVIPVIHLVRN